MATTRTIELRPTSRALAAPRSSPGRSGSIAEPLSIYLPLVIAKGRGATLTDVDGNTFIDFAGGVGCLNVGHSHPRVVEAVRDQAERFTHTDFTVLPYENYVGLAERLLDGADRRGDPRRLLQLGRGGDRELDQVRAAYTKRPAVIAFEGAFHGRTLLALSLTCKTHPYKAGLGPFAPEIYRVPFADLDALEYASRRASRRGRGGDRARARPGRRRLHRAAARVRAGPREAL